MSRRTEIACLWCMPFGLVILLIGLILSGYLPPPDQTMTPEQYQAFTIDHTTGTRIGITLMAFAGVLTVPWGVAISTEMAAVEGRRTPLAWTQLALCVASAGLFMAPLIPLMAAAYRPHSNPETLRAFQDMFWIPYVIAAWPFTGQAIVMAVFTFRQKRKVVVPRWFGFVCIMGAVGIEATTIDIFFKDGPFAITGLVGFWMPIVTVFIWWVSAFLVFRKAIAERVHFPPYMEGSDYDMPLPRDTEAEPVEPAREAVLTP